MQLSRQDSKNTKLLMFKGDEDVRDTLLLVAGHHRLSWQYPWKTAQVISDVTSVAQITSAGRVSASRPADVLLSGSSDAALKQSADQGR